MRKNLSRDQLIMRLHKRGETYACIGRNPEVRLGERQVQRIVKDMQHLQEQEIRELTAPAPAGGPDVPSAERATELVDSMELSLECLLDLVARFDQPVREALTVQLAKRKFENSAAELQSVIRALSG